MFANGFGITGALPSKKNRKKININHPTLFFGI